MGKRDNLSHRIGTDSIYIGTWYYLRVFRDQRMLCNTIELDPLVIAPDTLPLDIMEMRYPTVRGFHHIGEDVGCLLHTGLVILA